MIPLTLDEIISAIGGRATCRLPRVSVSGVSTDSRTCRAGELFLAIRGERFDGHAFVDEALERRAIAAIVETCADGDDRPLIRVGDTVAALGRLAAYHRDQIPTTVIAVTGSNGKTTTKCMIDHVLSRRLKGRGARASFNNAIGVPLTLLSARRGDDYLVVEIGSNARGEVAALAKMASPNVGVVTSIGDAHLAGFDNRSGVAVEKMSLLTHVRRGGLAVVNADNEDIERMVNRGVGCKVVTFGVSDRADVRVGDVVTCVDSTRFTINGRFAVTLAMPGGHNALNAAAAFAVCRRLALEPEEIIEALATFKLPPMRLNVVRLGRMTVIDDSYNANPESTAAAVEVLSRVSNGRRVFVAGDMLELGLAASALHEETGRRIGKANIDLLVAVGEYGDAVIDGARAVNAEVETIRYANTAAACRDLPKRLTEFDTVLFKGSRGMGLDRLARHVVEVFA